jgi:hypothetical protein
MGEPTSCQSGGAISQSCSEGREKVGESATRKKLSAKLKAYWAAKKKAAKK